MNPWAALLGEVALPAGEEIPGRVHVLADEINPETGKPASQPTRTKPKADPRRVPETCVERANRVLLENLRARPQWREPEILPAPAPTPTPKPAMTYAEAIKLRERRRNRQPVDTQELMEANRVVMETRMRAMPPGESYQ